MKCFVLDTNIIVDDPDALNNFDGRLKILPITVIEELDRLKRGVDERASNSRKASRIIKDALDSGRGDIVVLVESDLDIFDVKMEMMALDPDDLILLYYQVAVEKYGKSHDAVVLVTNDNNMFIKAKSYGFAVENVKRHTVEPTSDLEVKTITLPEHEFDQIAAGKIHVEASDYMTEFYNNQYIIIASEYSTKQTLLGKVFNGRILMLNPMHQEGYSGIKPKNKEQRFLFDALGEAHVDCVIVNGCAGSGKCLGKDTPVLMFDGSIKMVQDVCVGDKLMGPDSSPRIVKSLARGEEELYRVIPVKGESYVVNKSHILSLKMSGKSIEKKAFVKDGVVNITVEEYLDFDPKYKKYMKGWRTGVNFDNTYSLTIPPYILGVWLGDGCNLHCNGIANPDEEIVKEICSYAESIGYKVREKIDGNKCPIYYITLGEDSRVNVFSSLLKEMGLPGNKHIPHNYKTASYNDRLEILAGILDTDGCLGVGGYDYISKDLKLAEDVCFIARSLGLAAYLTPTMKKCQGWDKPKEYYRVSISGDCSIIPCRVERKKAPVRKQIKNVLRTGISLEPVGIGEYYGFEIDGPDRLFLLGDFTVTHNTLCSMATGLAKIMNERKSFDRMVITKPTYSIDNEIGHLPGSLEEKMLPHLAPFQDNLDYITKRLKLKDMKGIQENGLVEIMSLSFIRGRSIMDAFVIVDEIQNVPPTTIKTIVSRMSDTSKLILLGDITQIDNPSLNKQYNGLSYALNKLKGYENIACLQMTKSFRSRLAQIAVDVL